MPQFSIIIPCYNQADWLKICVQSLKNQTFENWEAIIVNDGSTDHTKETADFLAKNDPRIKVIHQDNCGLSSARNAGIQIAKGEWLNFLDSDDYLDINCLQMVFKAFENDSSFQMIQTGHHLVDEQNQIISTRIPQLYDGLFLDAISKGNDAPVLSVFIKRTFFDMLGEFDTTLKSAEDWDMWIRAAKNEGKRKIIYKALVSVRHLQNSMTRNPWRMYENTVAVIKRVPLKDNRIKHNSPLNIDTDFDVEKAIKARLIQALGLNIMQGNLDEALSKFNTESTLYNFHYNPIDFRQMNSFMTFKNWYRAEDVKKVLSDYPKFYVDFFSKTNFSSEFQKKACYYVFEFHLKNSNLLKYNFWGKIMNRVLDISVNSKKIREESGIKSL
jgi:glycosyltransferase involved in cell wall biosynthesis